MEASRERYRCYDADRQRGRSSLGAPDVGHWERELEHLITSGLTDITLGYWRVSTDGQVDAEGPDVQRQQIVAYAQVLAAPRYQVDLWVCDVESGTQAGRPGYQFIQRAATLPAVSRVIVARLDRFSREGSEGELTAQAMRRCGTALVSATERIPDDYVGDLVRIIFMGIAQYELALARHRRLCGRLAKARKHGVYLGGQGPYGYVNGPYWGTGGGFLKVNSAEAELVRLIFKLRDRGYSNVAIAKALNRWHLPLRRGSAWQPTHIRLILGREPAYRAEAPFSHEAGESSPISQEPILEHRSDPAARTYGRSDPKLPFGSRVPDDADGEPLPPPPRQGRKFLPEVYTIALKTCWMLSDERFGSQGEIAQELRRLNIPNRHDMPMTEQNVRHMIRRRPTLQRLVDQSCAQAATEPMAEGKRIGARHDAAYEFLQQVLTASHIHDPVSGRVIPLPVGEIARIMNDAGFRTVCGLLFDRNSVRSLIGGEGRRPFEPRGDRRKPPRSALSRTAANS